MPVPPSFTVDPILSLLTSRQERSEQRWWLVPGLDMVNAADSPSVRRVDRPGGVLELLAARDITEGARTQIPVKNTPG